MGKTKSIKGKILAMVLCISVASIIILSALAVFQLRKTGTYAAEDSSAALTAAGKDQLLVTATAKADMSNEKLSQFQTNAIILQNVATDIYQHPELYSRRPAKEPDAANAGTVVVHQFFDSTYVETPQTLREIEMLANIQDVLEQLGRNNPAIAAGSIYLATESGIIFMADVESDKHVGDFRYNEIHTRPWYDRAKRTGELGWTDVMTDESGRGLGIVCSAPVYDANGTLKAVVGVGAMLIDLDAIVNDSFSETGHSYVINDKGSVILSSQQGELNISPLRQENGVSVQDTLTTSSNGELAALSQEMMAGKSGVTQLTVDGSPVFAAYAPIPTLGWSFGTIISTDVVLAPSTELSNRIREVEIEALILMAVIAVLIIIAVIVVSGITAKRLSHPLLQLSSEVSRIGNGNFDYTLDIHTDDEIEILSDSFHKMTDELKAYIVNLQTVTAEKERIGAELNVATKIQKDMLPNIFPAFPERAEFDIYATMTPAKEVGGDFYDFFLVDDTHLAVVMADVSGKGVPAALFMVIAKTIIKNQTLSGDAVQEVFNHANDQLCENNSENLFVTAFMGVLDLKTGEFICVNAGHNPPLLRRKGETYEYLTLDPGLMLAGFEGMTYESRRLMLQPGDSIFLYTDGVTEALNPAEELYGEDRLRDALNDDSSRNATVRDVLPNIRASVDAYADGAEQADDITMLALTYLGNPEPETSGTEDAESWDRILDLPAETERLDDVQMVVENLIKDLPCSPEAVIRFQICVEEIFVNIAHYAYPEDGIGKAQIRFRVDPETSRLTIQFRDSGVPFNPLDRDDPDITLSADERGIGGLGIFMVKTYMDEVNYSYENGENILTFTATLT